MVYIDIDIDIEQIYNSILDYYDKEEHKGDDTWFYYAKHEVIDDYCVKFEKDAKEIVNKYGIFKAIKLHQDNFGEFIINDRENKNYLMLFYLIIDEKLMDEYQDKLENIRCEDE